MDKKIEEERDECYRKARNDLKKMGNPVEAIKGMMKHVKETSLELQKGTNKWRAERYFRKRKKWMSEENLKEKIKS